MLYTLTAVLILIYSAGAIDGGVHGQHIFFRTMQECFAAKQLIDERRSSTRTDVQTFCADGALREGN